MTMPIPDGAVIITPRQMYDELQATRQAVERLTNTVDPAITDLRGEVVQARADVATLFSSRNSTDTRVTIVETKLKVIAWLLGVIVLPGIGAVSAILAVMH